MNNEKLNLKNLSLHAAPLNSFANGDRPGCQVCGLYRSCHTPGMYPYVPRDWKAGQGILCIGEGPGEHEDEISHRPFTGPSGNLLKKIYRHAGYQDSNVAYCNAIRCRVRKNGKPSMLQIRACRPFVLKTIISLQPKFILGLGSIALKCLTNNGDGNLTKNRGKRLAIPGLELAPIAYVTYHPASVLWGNYEFEERIREDFKRFKLEQLLSPKINLPRQPNIGFDTEYTPDNKLLTLGVADSKRTKAFETSEKGWLKKIRSIFKKATTISGHMVTGDIDYLVKYGLAKEKWLKGIDVKDSMILARMVDENRGRGAYGLEPLLLSEFNFQEWKAETAKLLKKTGDASDWGVEQRKERCRIDAWATKILADKLILKLK